MYQAHIILLVPTVFRANAYNLQDIGVDRFNGLGVNLHRGFRKGTVQRVLERYRDSGSVEPKPQNPGRKSAFSKEDLRRLKRDILSNQDATLEELRGRSRVNVSIVSFHNVIKKLGFTRKKIVICYRAAACGCSTQARRVLPVVGWS